jgi:ABC-2 type transport system permease protein
MGIIEGFVYREFNLKRASLGTFLAQLINPVIYVVFFATSMSGLLASVEYRGQTYNYFIFVLPGLLTLQTFLVFPFVGSLVASDKRFGLIRTFFISKGTPSKYVLGKIIVEGAVVFVECFFMLAIGFLFSGFLPLISNLLLMSIMIGLAFLFWLSLGILFGLFVKGEVSRAAILTLTNLPVLFTSPMFYTLNEVPAWVSIGALINPLRYHVDSIRDAMFGILSPTTFIIVLVMSSLTLLISLLILKKASITP